MRPLRARVDAAAGRGAPLPQVRQPVLEPAQEAWEEQGGYAMPYVAMQVEQRDKWEEHDALTLTLKKAYKVLASDLFLAIEVKGGRVSMPERPKNGAWVVWDEPSDGHLKPGARMARMVIPPFPQFVDSDEKRAELLLGMWPSIGRIEFMKREKAV